MSESNREMAMVVYNSVCKVLEDMNLKYNKNEEKMLVSFMHKGDELEHEVFVLVDDNKEVLQVFEKLPIQIDESKAYEVAAAVCYVNERTLTGKFTYNMKERIFFEIAQVYEGSLLGEETIKRLILSLAFSVEKYDDKFLALNKGYIKPEAFLE